MNSQAPDIPPDIQTPHAPFPAGRITLLLAILILAIAAAFGRSMTASFVDLDDSVYAFKTPQIIGGLTPQNVFWAWRKWHSGYYIPLTWMSLQLDATLTGPAPQSPPGEIPPLPDAAIFHLTSLVLYCTASSFLFLFLYRATASLWPSFLVTLFWAIHPLRAESVAWITERKEMLDSVFGFLALYLYVIWCDRRRPIWYAASCISLGLALLSKGTFVTLPFILILLDFWPLKRWRSLRDIPRAAWEKWPFFALSAVGCALVFVSQRGVGTAHPAGAGGLANALLSYGRYLVMQFDFRGLAPFYPLGPVPTTPMVASAAVLLAITALCLWLRRSKPNLLLGWLWYLGTLVPMIGIVQAGDQSYADRFTFLPSIGLGIMLVFAIPATWYRNTGRLAAVLTGATAVTAILLVFTFRQVGYWHDTYTLFTHARDVTPPNTLVHVSLADAYMRDKQTDRAMDEYVQAIAINPKYAEARLRLGMVLLYLGKPDEALPNLQVAVAVDPTDIRGHDYYGVALFKLGRLEEAVAELETAVRTPSPDVDALALARQHLQAAQAVLATRPAGHAP